VNIEQLVSLSNFYLLKALKIFTDAVFKHCGVIIKESERKMTTLWNGPMNKMTHAIYLSYSTRIFSSHGSLLSEQRTVSVSIGLS
jgi:hypothetical protein